MASPRSNSPKRRRSNNNDSYADEPPRKRSASRTPPNASPSYRLAERPARRYSREDSADRRYYRDRERRRSETHSRSTSPRRRSHSPRGGASSPPKPTALHYHPTLILHGHKKAISCIKFSPDGRWIASASADCTIKIWDAATGDLQHTLEGHLAGISTISWAPDSRILASGSDDKSIRLWDTTKGLAHPTSFTGHHNYVYSLAFSPKGNMLVSGSYDEAVYVWDVRAARVMRSLPAHSDPVGGVDFVRDGTLIVSCSHDGLIRVWDTATGQCLRTLVHEDNAPVSAVLFSPNGRYILAWTLDNCVRLWNYVDGKGKCVKTYQGHGNSKYSLSGAFGTYGSSPPDPSSATQTDHPTNTTTDDADAKSQFAFIASGSEDGSIFLWDVSSKNILQRLTGHTDAVLSVATHPRWKMIASGGMDRAVRLWRQGAGPAPAAVPSSGGGDGREGGATAQGERRARGEEEQEHGAYDPDVLPPNPFA